MTLTSYTPYDVEIESVALVNYRGNAIDLRNLLLEFNVYEDVYDAGMKCDVLVSDSLGLIERIPVVGDETLVISFRTPTFDRLRSYAFHVYSVKDRTKHKDRSYSYVIHGVSHETINDVRRSVERSYSDVGIGDVVRSVYDEYLRPDESEFRFISSRTRRLEVETTKGTHSFVSPENTTPVELIRFLQKYARSAENEASDYMFFQNHDGWHFRTLSSLVQREPVDSFYFTETAQEPDRDNTVLTIGGVDHSVRQYQKIAFVNYDTQFNVLDLYSQGLYENTVESVDTLRKTTSTNSFLYDRDFGRMRVIPGKKIITDNSPHAATGISGPFRMVPEEVGENYRSTEYLSRARDTDPRVRNPVQRGEYLPLQVASMAKFNGLVIDVGIPGHSDLKTGDKVRVYMQQGSVEKEYSSMNNLLFGQRDPSFLVTAVRHTFNRERNRYLTVLQCVRDTYGSRPVQRDD